MDRLKQIGLFAEVARARSFTAAARRLGMSRASVTKHVAALERALAVRLLNRTTQHVSLTESGRLLMEEGGRIQEEFDRLEARLRDAEEKPKGFIRVGTPPAFGEAHLAPAVVAFTRLHPEMRVELHLDDGSSDLVRDSLDLSLRISSALKDASHVARFIIRVPQVLVASPVYLREHGMPKSVSDLPRHNCLIHRANAPNDVWRFGADGNRTSVHVTGSISSNFGEVLRASALMGAGISMHAIYMVDQHVRAGRLRVVLPGSQPSELAINAIYPRRNPPVRVGMFIDFLREWFPRQASWLKIDGQEPPEPASKPRKRSPKASPAPKPNGRSPVARAGSARH